MSDEPRDERSDPGPGPGPDPGSDPEAVRRRAARDRARQQVFGDVLDGATLDDRPDPGAVPDTDRWLRENVPPHHG